MQRVVERKALAEVDLAEAAVTAMRNGGYEMSGRPGGWPVAGEGAALAPGEGPGGARVAGGAAPCAAGPACRLRAAAPAAIEDGRAPVSGTTPLTRPLRTMVNQPPATHTDGWLVTGGSSADEPRPAMRGAPCARDRYAVDESTTSRTNLIRTGILGPLTEQRRSPGHLPLRVGPRLGRWE